MRCDKSGLRLCDSRNSAGFTIVELMMVVAVAAILVSIGVPSFTAMMDRVELDTAGRELVNSLQGAREMAVTKGVAVTIEKNASVFTCSYTDKSNTTQSCATFPASSSQVTITPTPNISTIHFDPDGRVDAALQFTVQHSGVSDYSYAVRIRSSGRVSLHQI